jgi:nucleoid DNA-binding protein
MDKPKRKREEDFYREFKSISKTKLIDLVSKRLPQIKKNHVYSVTQVFFEQFEKDLFKNKMIEIGNFIKFNLHRMKEKSGRNYYTGEIITTKPFNTIKISLNSKLNKKLLQYLDLDFLKKDKE